MPVEPFEFIKLTIGVLIIIIPGYLWSFLFSKQITTLERLVFGFISGLGVITCGTFLINTFFDVPITKNFVIFLFAIYTISAFVFFPSRSILLIISLVISGIASTSSPLYPNIRSLSITVL